jgi:hypothetical protein
MTDGHIVTIVQNVIAGHGSLFRTAEIVLLSKFIRFVPYLVVLRIYYGGCVQNSIGITGQLI